MLQYGGKADFVFALQSAQVDTISGTVYLTEIVSFLKSELIQLSIQWSSELFLPHNFFVTFLISLIISLFEPL